MAVVPTAQAQMSWNLASGVETRSRHVEFWREIFGVEGGAVKKESDRGQLKKVVRNYEGAEFSEQELFGSVENH